jgi:hypothetical protein
VLLLFNYGINSIAIIFSLVKPCYCGKIILFILDTSIYNKPLKYKK